jgi:hypothetical protein
MFTRILAVLALSLPLAACCGKALKKTEKQTPAATSTSTTTGDNTYARSQCDSHCRRMFSSCPNNDRGIPACVSVCQRKPDHARYCADEAARLSGNARCTKASNCMVSVAR